MISSDDRYLRAPQRCADRSGAAVPEPCAFAEPVDEIDREHATWRIRAALEDGVLDLEQAGQRLSAVYRAPSRTRLNQLVRDLDPPENPAHDGLDRATLLRAGLRILLFVALTALLLTVLLHGIDRY